MTSLEVFELARTRAREGDHAEAEKLFRLLLAQKDRPIVNYNLALSLLAQGRYREGFERFEDRRRMAADVFRVPPFSYPEWTGEPVPSLLVLGEQGFGDCIMFGRYIPLLRARGIDVTVGVRPGLEGLFAEVAPTIALAGEVSIPRHSAWALMGSLPRLMGAEPATVPPAVYLQRGRGGGGVGFAWRGRTDPPNDARRSLHAPSLPGISLDPEDTGAQSFAETAEIIRGLDLVISVDTAVAHLAASMGVPTWVLLINQPCWRWTTRERSPWYPDVRLFRQDADHAWEPVLERVREAVKEDGVCDTPRT